MAEEGDYWQETAQMYEQLIEKPKMTQKLLCKPPFRYIHDIYTATLAVTGYGNGLFDEAEMDGKAITEKDAKINWLVKLLQLTELVIGEEIDCKPTKIVAGHEPEKTNFFLQQMFQAATAGIDTTPHVMQILGIGQEEGDEQDEQALAEAEAAA
jgi:TRAF3-interacting protein 1